MLLLRLYGKSLIIVLIKVTIEYCHILLAYFLSAHKILGLQEHFFPINVFGIHLHSQAGMVGKGIAIMRRDIL